MLFSCFSIYLTTFYDLQTYSSYNVRMIMNETWLNLRLYQNLFERPIQPPTQRVPGALSFGVKRPGRGGEHSPPSNVVVKNASSRRGA
jgi:hypothetical protein